MVLQTYLLLPLVFFSTINRNAIAISFFPSCDFARSLNSGTAVFSGLSVTATHIVLMSEANILTGPGPAFAVLSLFNPLRRTRSNKPAAYRSFPRSKVELGLVRCRCNGKIITPLRLPYRGVVMFPG